MKLINFACRCQSKTIQEQYKAGARYFDLRFRFDKDDKLVLAHGLIEYDPMYFYSTLLHLNGKALSCKIKVYVRTILEIDKPNEHQEKMFEKVCRNLQCLFRHLTFVGGLRKFDFAKLYDFGTQEPTLLERHNSVDRKTSWRKYLYPWLWAKLHNKKVLAEIDNISEDFVMIDFI
jgi:hypothetical protein